ncbi:hypothetical protein [Candidatus Palauibacter sp.]|uniref:hypothetical protein n=1 Tax=Candidatus Palauibacter sp. TaxID=3101350 RepID=UPI003B02DB92
MRPYGPAAKMIGGCATLLLVCGVAACGAESAVELAPAFEGPPCRVGQELGPGQSCTDGVRRQPDSGHLEMAHRLASVMRGRRPGLELHIPGLAA